MRPWSLSFIWCQAIIWSIASWLLTGPLGTYLQNSDFLSPHHHVEIKNSKLWDVITYPCLRYLHFATKSSYIQPCSVTPSDVSMNPWLNLILVAWGYWCVKKIWWLRVYKWGYIHDTHCLQIIYETWGPTHYKRCCLTSIGIPIIKVRWSQDHPLLIMVICILVRQCLCIKSAHSGL